jgi:hypothetical protein
VPVLIRLRYVQVEQMPQESDQWADQLWVLGLQERALLAGQGDHIYQPDQGRWFQPVWLLDGLDEMMPPPDERFYQALVNLPGLKVLSCRTAVYETLRREADRYKDQEYELLGLTPADQKTFLTHALNGDARRAEALHDRLQHNPQLRLLTGNPLMLSLMTQVADTMAVPETRAAFYQVAVSELWSRRLAHHLGAYTRTHERDQVLTELAERMGMAQITAPLAWLTQAASRVAGADGQALLAALEHTGLVRLHPGEQVDFIHLTFQEFYLGQALVTQGLPQALSQYWADARYEETLGLLIAIKFQAQQYGEIDQSLRRLVEWGEATHRRTPAVLWGRRRSPLRVVLHLLHRAGVPLEHLPRLADFLWEKLNRAPRRSPRRVALHLLHRAARPSEYAPHFMEFFIRRFTRTNQHWVRNLFGQSVPRKGAAASDANMPLYILWKLAQDAEIDVRTRVAGNASTPPELLARLAQDAEAHVRAGVGMNAGTPPELLARLAQDATDFIIEGYALEGWVRAGVAGNASTPPELLAHLAQDAGALVRESVGMNASTPPELLARLAQEADPDVSESVTGNASVLLEDL